jgi:hypothetical protein
MSAPVTASQGLMSADDETSAAVYVFGGRYNWTVWGTWDGASAQLQWSPNVGTTWIDVDGAALTANGGWSDIPIAEGSVRVTISSAGGTTSLTSKLGGVP